MTISELIERLEKAADFDREADREIGRLLLGWKVTDAYIQTDSGDVYPNHPGAEYPSFTESVDTAIALAESVLPGRQINIHRFSASLAEASTGARGAFPTARAVTPSIALCIAILRALQAKEAQP